MFSPSSESVYSNKLLIPVNSERGGGGGRGGARRSPESRESQQEILHQNAQKEVERNGKEEGKFGF